MTRRRASGRPSLRGRRRKGRGNLVWVALIAVALAGFGAIGFAVWKVNQRPGFDSVTNCPDTGPVGAIAVLIDVSGGLGRTQETRLRSEIARMIEEAPTGTVISLGSVSDHEDDRGARVALCKPLSGEQVDAMTGNPLMVNERYRRSFLEPIEAEIATLMGLGESGESARQRQFRNLEASLDGSGAVLIDTGSELVITLPEAITFDTGSSALRAGLDSYLSAIASSLSEHPRTTVQIVGHSDDLGSLEVNQELSERRAAVVAEVLIGAGASRDRIRTIGRAFLEPVAANDSEAGRRANRRVELILASKAPIMESLQALVADTPLLVEDGLRRAELGERKIVIISDLLQNSETLSFYRGQEWAEFRESRDFGRLGRNLHGVRVEILRLPRDEPAIRDPSAVNAFWRDYFDYQGAVEVRARIIGDL